MKPSTLIKGLLLGALLGFAYYPTFVWMADRWMASDSYYAHGFLIPLVSLFWIYTKRDAIRQAERETDPRGLIVLLAGVGLQAVSFFLRFYFLSAFSFVITLLGLVLYLTGRNVFRQIWFPILFLAFMIPLPLLVIAQVTLKLKFFVSEIATWLINQTKIEAVRQGSYIYMPNSVLVVGDPCSGLRSFLAFLTLGFIFAYDPKLSFWKKAVVVTSGLPLAIASNVIRVVFLGFFGEIYGMEHTGPGQLPHDLSGIVVFVVAFICFMEIRKKLGAFNVSK